MEEFIKAVLHKRVIVSQKRAEIPRTDEHIDLITNAITLEKYFRVTDRGGLALGNTYSINTDENKFFTGYARINYDLTKRIRLFLAGSYGRDTDGYEYVTGSVYSSIIF